MTDLTQINSGPAEGPVVRDVPIQPLPVGASVGIVNTDEGQVLIALQFRTPSGEQTYFYTPESASRLATKVLKQSRAAMAMEAQSAKLVGVDGRKLV